jgi:malonate decarboxylase delta subunit
MEVLNYEYAARRVISARAHVGVVGSGDLEILMEPSSDNASHVRVRTSVDGFARDWKAVLDRFFSHFDGAVNLEINDAGATPGCVALRLDQAVEACGQ